MRATTWPGYSPGFSIAEMRTMNEGGKLEFHEVANIFPIVEGDEFRELCEDIKEHGQQQAILTYEGKILDGRNRYRACLEVGEEPWTERWTGDDPIEAVLSLNLYRRHLTSGQKAVIAQDAEKILAKEARERRAATLKQNSTVTEGERDTPLVKELTNGNERKASSQAAKLLGTNRQYVSDAKKLSTEDPEAAEAVRRGEVSLPKAMEPYRKPKEEKPDHPPLAGEDRTTAREALGDMNDISLGSWGLTKEEDAYWNISKHLVAISRLDPEKVAKSIKSAEDADKRASHADALIDWFGKYKSAAKRRGEELKPGQLRAIGGGRG